MKEQLTIIPHKALDAANLNQIIRIKSCAWPYSYEDQLDWIDMHLSPSDLHVFYHVGDQPVAYLNLIDTTVWLDDKQVAVYGVGNVCVIHKGQGQGLALMKLVTDFIHTGHRLGMLFCKKPLISFYEKAGWSVLAHQACRIELPPAVHVMVSCRQKEVECLRYDGNLF